MKNSPEFPPILLAYAEEPCFNDLSGCLRTAKSLRIPRKKLASENEKT